MGQEKVWACHMNYTRYGCSTYCLWSSSFSAVKITAAKDHLGRHWQNLMERVGQNVHLPSAPIQDSSLG